jgi:ABC-type transport system substrate-binding protein
MLNPGDSGNSLPALESLLEIDSVGKGNPRLATSFQTSPDGKTITFNLRKGVKFHDGTDFNATVAKFNLSNRMAEASELAGVASVDVVDDFTIRLNLKFPDNMVLPTVSTTAGMQASMNAIQTNGKDWARMNPIGTGPFKFVDFKPKVSLTYQRFDGYWQPGKPYLDGLQLLYIGDATTAQLAFQKGEGQMMSSNPKAANDLRNQPGVQVKAAFVSGNSSLFPDSKNADSPFAKKGVREAVEYAIDKEGLVKALGYGFWRPANQIIPSTIFGYNKDLKDRAYDPAKAKQLLADNGYPNGFKTSIVFTNPDRDWVETVQSFLKAVGIDVEAQLVDTARQTTIRSTGWKNGLVVGPMATNINWNQAIQRSLVGTPRYYASLALPAEFEATFAQSIGAIDDGSRGKFLNQLSKMAYDEATIINVKENQSAYVGREAVHSDYLVTHHVYWTPGDAWMGK